jgi:SAM-dependent methyltransferase
MLINEGEVAAQYEAMPYPSRDPKDEDSRLIGTWLDDLDLLNHHCFRGARDFRSGFRVLVAGGGTGDGTIFIAEQLRERGVTGARLVHLDLSAAAIRIAQERAQRRGLSGIEFIQGDLLDLPSMNLGAFDFINCVGVLHHLPEPDRGLKALLGALADEGAIAVLLYGKIGRIGIYHAQEILRRLPGNADYSARIAQAKRVLAKLPRSNWLSRSAELHPDLHQGGDAALYDLLLHSQDRAYDVEEIYRWFTDGHGMSLYFSDVHRGRLPYSPTTWLHELPEHSDITAMSQRDQESLAELIGGDLTLHAFFATRHRDSQAPYGELDYVPFFLRETHPATGPSLAGVIDSHRCEPFLLTHGQSGLRREMHPTASIRNIFQAMDGQRTWREIFDTVRLQSAHPLRHGVVADQVDQQLFAEFAPWWDALRSIERLLLRRNR